MRKEINEIRNIQDQQANTLKNEERHHHEIEDRMRFIEGQKHETRTGKKRIT